MQISRDLRFTYLGRYKLVNHTTLQNYRSCTLTTIIILKLHQTSYTSICRLKPSLRIKDTHITERRCTVRFLCHSNTWHVDKVKTYRWNWLSIIMTKDKTIVRFVVEVKVSRHHSERLASCRRIFLHMNISHKYNGMVIYRTTCC